MSDIRIRTNAGCIENYCNERLFNKDDSKEIRDVFRQILAHVKAILEADADERKKG
jgi:hypothetical protein